MSEDGTFNATLNMSEFTAHRMLGIDGDKLLVSCDVIEHFTDANVSSSATAMFARAVYNVTFERSAPFFKAGLPYVFQVQIFSIS